MKLRKITPLIFSILMTFASVSAAFEIVIDKGIETALPIAIVPFSWSQASIPPFDVAGVISKNLRRSGRFAPMDIKDLPQRPNDFQEIAFKDWRLLGIENLVIGKLTLTNSGDYQIEFRLIDIYKGKQIAGFHFKTQEDKLRWAAHEISDIIYQKLIGVLGAFATRIAYVTVNKQNEQQKKYTLQIADADGHDPKILLESYEPLLSPAWSPDGRKIAYVSFESGNSAVYIQNLKTGERQEIAAHPGINSAPAWSPDGSRLAMVLSKDGNAEIYIVHISTGSLQRITNNAAIDTEPNWSPDGNKLIFTSDRGGSPQIYQLSIDGSKPRRISFRGTYNARPVYAHDGHRIAMVHGDQGSYRIALLDQRNGTLNILTDAKLDESPSFAPNGHIIIYTSIGIQGAELAAVSADGEVRQRLALQKGEVREPAWGPFLSKP